MKSRHSGALLGAFLLAAAPAFAAPVSSGNLTGGGATWQTIFNGGFGAGSFFTVNDASIGGQGDAYDGGLTFQVGGTNYTTPGGTFDLTGQTATGGTTSIAGLNVSVQYYADTGSPTLRTLITLQNAGLSIVNTTVRLQTNNGSDGATQTIATSSGDLAFTAADRWIITDDSVSGGDPTNTHVLWGSGALVTPSGTGLTVFSAAGTQGILADYDLQVLAGTTRSLLFFNQIHTTAALAQGAVGTFDNLGSNSALLAGLSGAQLAQVANWNFGGQSVPLPGTLALVGLGLAGLGLGRRR